MTEGYRRPRQKWCTDTAIKLLQIGTREEELLDAETRNEFIRVAAKLDVFGQQVGVDPRTKSKSYSS